MIDFRELPDDGEQWEAFAETSSTFYDLACFIHEAVA